MRRRISLQQNLINHVGFVLDASASMSGRERELIRVADELIEFLKEKSQSYNQETRVTMYIFGADTQTACYDVDVLRTPSIRDMYEATGPRTALIDATLFAIEEMKQTATLHGDHAFLLYVLTDGQENNSSNPSLTLTQTLNRLPENWTPAILVPDRMGQRAAVRFGFDIENTMIWDATTDQGVREVGTRIQQATDNYMQARATGVRGTRSLFSMDVHNLRPTLVDSALQEVPSDRWTSFTVDPQTVVIRDAVEKNVGAYRTGCAFYQLTKTETIQPQKQIAVREKSSGKLFSGAAARQLLGLPNAHARVAPANHPLYDIFVQSTSVNRKLVPNTTAIVMR